MPTDKLLELEGLTKYFYKPMGLLGRRKQVVQSVDHVSFHILRHETFGLVGESGCGKSTLGRTITRLYEPTEGKILYDGTDISHLTGPQLLPYRKRIQMIFQDPYASLDSRMTVMDIIREALDLHSELTTKEQRSQRVYELLDHVGLMREHANRYPHEFSGGQRQRIGIAVMYLGKLVEVGDSEEIYQNHLHPYTEALLSSVPLPDPELAHRSEPIMLQGDIPSPIDPPSGCRFRTRCPYATQLCAEQEPPLTEVGSNHAVACHRVTPARGNEEKGGIL